MVSRVARFGHYSMTFEERSDGQYCFVHTWEGNSLLSLCVNVEKLGQRVPHAELSSLSRVVTSLPSGLMPLSIRGMSPSLLRVVSDERSDGRRFILARSEILVRNFPALLSCGTSGDLWNARSDHDD